MAARVALDGSLAVRLPGASPAAELARRFGRPLSATSANLPGAPPATRSAAVESAFASAVANGTLLVLSGESPGGAPSTVVRVSESDYAVARAGAVPPSQLDEIARARDAACLTRCIAGASSSAAGSARWRIMARVINFNAGPAALPLGALERAQKELLDISGSGMSVMEHSHRGKVYEAIHDEAIALLKELMAIPDNYDILFLQGGASQQFAVVPMNLLPQGKSADYIQTGAWSQKALQRSQGAGHRARCRHTEKDKKFCRVPEAERARAGSERGLRAHHQQQHHLRHAVA